MKQNKETLKKHFETGDKPTQGQYSDLIDSYVDSKQPEGEANRRFVIDETGEVSVAAGEKAPEYNLQQVSDNGSKTTNKLTVENSFDATGKLDLSHNEVAMANSRQSTFLLQQRLAMLDEQTKLNFDVNNGSFTSTHQKTDGSSSLSLAFPTEELKQETTSSNKSLKLPNKAGTVATLDDVPQMQAGTNITIDKTDPKRPIINATGSSGGGSTNLSYNASARTLASSSGTDALLPLANKTNAGLMKANFYEEGAFIATLLDHDTGATYSMSSQTSHYMRMGNMVQLTINLENITTVGTVSGASLRIANIPFSAANFTGFTSGSLSSFRNSELSENEAKDLVPVITSNSDYISFSQNGAGFLGGNFTNGNVRLTIVYKTNVYTP